MSQTSVQLKQRTWWIAPVFGVLVLLVFLVLPPAPPLTVIGMRAIGVMLFTIIWWISVGISYPSFLCVALFIITDVLSVSAAFSAALGSWIIFFAIGCFGMAEGLRATGFSRRFALWFLTRRFAVGRPWMIMSLFLLACLSMGAIMSLTVTVIVFMTIAASMLTSLGYKKGDQFAATIMMGIAWTATAAHAMTPIAHAGNVMVMEWLLRDFGYSISFPQWMLFGIPVGVSYYILLILFFRYVVRPDISRFTTSAGQFLGEEMKKLGPMKFEEKVAVVVFLGVVVCWVLPGSVGGTMPGVSAFFNRIGFAVPAIVGASLLCFTRIKGTPLLSFHKWMTEGVEWGSIALLAAIMTIGAVIGKPETGIALFMTNIFEPISRSVPFYVLILLTFVWVIAQTNIMSNLVSMTLVYTVMIPIIAASGVGNPVASGVAIAAASNYAFVLPSATTTTAIIIGSGWVSPGFMLKYGLMFILPTVLIFAFIYYPFACFIFR